MRKETIKNITLIYLGVLLLNTYATFGLDGLLKDDWFRYSTALHDKFVYEFSSLYTGIVKNTMIPFYKVLLYSAPLARLLVILLVMAPVSVLIHYLYRQYLNLPNWFSLFAAVIPSGLVMQPFFPAYIDGTYMLIGVLFSLLSLQILNSKGYSRAHKTTTFIAGTLLFWISTIYTELSLAIIPFAFAAAYIRQESMLDFARRFSPYVFISLVKVVQVLQTPHGPTRTITGHSLETILERIQVYFAYALPYPFFVYREDYLWTLPAGLVSILLALLFLSRLKVFKSAGKESSMNYRNSLLWGGTWFVSYIAIFAFVSPSFTYRYNYTAAFGIVLISLLILKYFFDLFKNEYLSKVLVAMVFMICLAERHFGLYMYFKPLNNCYGTIKSQLLEYSFPKDSQIAIEGDCRVDTGGLYPWSSGFLQYALKRKDIHGTLLTQESFIDPFVINTWGVSQNLSLDKPLFMFRMESRDHRLVPVKYGLRWSNNEWTIIETKQGLIEQLRTGKGIVNLNEYISSNDISTAETTIMWYSKKDFKL